MRIGHESLDIALLHKSIFERHGPSPGRTHAIAASATVTRPAELAESIQQGHADMQLHHLACQGSHCDARVHTLAFLRGGITAVACLRAMASKQLRVL
jgi:hypothetical protein